MLHCQDLIEPMTPSFQGKRLAAYAHFLPEGQFHDSRASSPLRRQISCSIEVSIDGF